MVVASASASAPRTPLAVACLLEVGVLQIPDAKSRARRCVQCLFFVVFFSPHVPRRCELLDIRPLESDRNVGLLAEKTIVWAT